jgi:hypothetical protein
LETRILIIQVRENYNFFNKITDYVKRLKEYFNVDYSEDEVETALNELQDAEVICEENVMELEEDYD